MKRKNVTTLSSLSLQLCICISDNNMAEIIPMRSDLFDKVKR